MIFIDGAAFFSKQVTGWKTLAAATPMVMDNVSLQPEPMITQA